MPFKTVLTNRGDEVDAGGEGQEEKAEDTAKCQGVQENGGNAVLTVGRKALCAQRRSKPLGPPSPPAKQKWDSVTVQIYALCPENTSLQY